MRRSISYYISSALLCVLPLQGFAGSRGDEVGRAPSQVSTPDALPVVSVSTDKLSSQKALPQLSSNYYLAKRYVEGIDVSRYQGEIDWSRVMEGNQISYVYLKATEGETLLDRTYKKNLAEARRVGLRVGSYHFYRPNSNWKRQLRNLVKHVRVSEQQLVPIIDIEVRGRVSAERFIRDLKRFVVEVEKHYGCKPMLYTYQNFYNKHLVGHFESYPLMIARYRTEAPALDDGAEFVMWQYTDSGFVDGVNGCVDRSCIMDGYRLHMLELE